MPRLIKVAIDISPIKTGHKVRGVGMYTKRLVEALEKLRIENGKWKIDAINFTNNQLPITNYDLAHYPYFDLFFLTLPLRKPIKTIVTIHDVIPLLFPEHYPPGIKGKMKFLIQKFSLRGVSAVITDSQNSKRDIFKYLNYPSERIFIVPLAPGKEFKKLEIRNLPAGKASWKLEIRERYSLPDKFVLYVGDINWNKNVLGLVKACKKIQIPLVIVGKQAAQKDFNKTHVENQPLVQLIREYGDDPDVLRLGFVPEKDLVKIYNLASVYCQPSYYEGFGLPVLEAMACGCPVVVAKVASLPEVCGDAALMVDPEDYNDIARGLKKVIGSKKTCDRLIKKGFEQAKKFSWEKTAKETLGVYEKVA